MSLRISTAFNAPTIDCGATTKPGEQNARGNTMRLRSPCGVSNSQNPNFLSLQQRCKRQQQKKEIERIITTIKIQNNKKTKHNKNERILVLSNTTKTRRTGRKQDRWHVSMCMDHTSSIVVSTARCADHRAVCRCVWCVVTRHWRESGDENVDGNRRIDGDDNFCNHTNVNNVGYLHVCSCCRWCIDDRRRQIDTTPQHKRSTVFFLCTQQSSMCR
jgi:hypothetical protein